MEADDDRDSGLPWDLLDEESEDEIVVDIDPEELIDQGQQEQQENHLLQHNLLMYMVNHRIPTTVQGQDGPITIPPVVTWAALTNFDEILRNLHPGNREIAFTMLQVALENDPMLGVILYKNSLRLDDNDSWLQPVMFTINDEDRARLEQIVKNTIRQL